ncbi:MAG: MiaB/RimO family radical SAM methylthiotransferase, partial [Elusimicrobia bacterium]|nr:MiaB/RimO family radical SAM methylthiotransferase [Elusimicrobiota bacterium]
RFYIRTFGCQMNFSDSNLMKNILADGGFEFTQNPENADIIIFNSCSVRAHAEDRLFSNIGLYMKKYPQAKFVLSGCTAKRFGQNVFKKFPKVDAVVGPSEIPAISEIVRGIFEHRKIIALGEAEYPVIRRKGGVSEYVVIQRGCDNFCSYCVVPFLRGREKYRKPREILDEIRNLASSGTREVVLLGQNVNSYKGETVIPRLISPAFGGGRKPPTLISPLKGGRDRGGFPELLRKIAEIPEIVRIRFLTSHPKDVPDNLIEEMAVNKKIAHHIHLPVQSGSDRILKLMNRKYTSGKYLEIIEKLRNKIPDIAITTDIICGFPTETDRDFEDTLSLMKKAKFSGVFAFKYSPREETAAFKMKDDVSQKVKQERLKIIQKLALKYADLSRRNFVGKEVEVLFEKDGVGHSSQNFLVLKQGAKAGEFLRVKVKKTSRWCLFV